MNNYYSHYFTNENPGLEEAKQLGQNHLECGEALRQIPSWLTDSRTNVNVFIKI